MKIIVTDRIDDKQKKLKPIELLSCLQSATIRGIPQFDQTIFKGWKGDGYPIGTTKIERICDQDFDNKIYSIVLVHIQDDPFPCIFIAHWNDGII